MLPHFCGLGRRILNEDLECCDGAFDPQRLLDGKSKGSDAIRVRLDHINGGIEVLNVVGLTI